MIFKAGPAENEAERSRSDCESHAACHSPPVPTELLGRDVRRVAPT
jgi:hypothetical protein